MTFLKEFCAHHVNEKHVISSCGVEAASQVLELSVRFTDLMCVLEAAASEMQLLSSSFCHDLSLVCHPNDLL